MHDGRIEGAGGRGEEDGKQKGKRTDGDEEEFPLLFKNQAVGAGRRNSVGGTEDSLCQLFTEEDCEGLRSRLPETRSSTILSFPEIIGLAIPLFSNRPDSIICAAARRFSTVRLHVFARNKKMRLW